MLEKQPVNIKMDWEPLRTINLTSLTIDFSTFIQGCQVNNCHVIYVSFPIP
jgi:hypothetical protein